MERLKIADIVVNAFKEADGQEVYQFNFSGPWVRLDRAETERLGHGLLDLVSRNGNSPMSAVSSGYEPFSNEDTMRRQESW